MYHVEIEYWNGGRELVTGEPVTWKKAMQIKQHLLLGSVREEYFVNILKVEDMI